MAAMADFGIILFSIVPNILLSAMIMDLINSVLSAIGNKNILVTLADIKGNEKEHAEISKAINKVGLRYLPVFLFLLVDFFHMRYGLSLQAVRISHLFLETWALIYSWNLPGFNINAFGGCLNMLVCSANKGLMPTIFYPESDGRHMLMTDATRFNFLSDWIVVNSWMLSIGDLLIIGGSLIFLLHQYYLFLKILTARNLNPELK